MSHRLPLRVRSSGHLQQDVVDFEEYEDEKVEPTPSPRAIKEPHTPDAAIQLPTALRRDKLEKKTQGVKTRRVQYGYFALKSNLSYSRKRKQVLWQKKQVYILLEYCPKKRGGGGESRQTFTGEGERFRFPLKTSYLAGGIWWGGELSKAQE